MISFEEAYRLVRANVVPLNAVEVGLAESCGMVLAEDVSSDIDMPPFDKSFRDGYAVRASDIGSVPAILKVVGESKAGRAFPGRLEPGQAVHIMTGASVPEGADLVVMVEETEMISEDDVRINAGPKRGSFIGKKGDDVKKDAKVLEKGRPIREAELAVLATVGKARVKVFRRPSVAVIVTGDELVGVGEMPEKWQIRDCNGPLLVTMLRGEGFEVEDLGVVADQRGALKRAVQRGLKSDVLLLSGGVSAGKYDFVPEILESLGVRKVFHKARMKPGKPIYFGKLSERIIFGMPGNPVSAFLSYKIFVRPALNIMMGMDRGGFKTEKGVVNRPIKRGRRKTFLPTFASGDNGRWFLEPAGWRGSADIFALARSNAFAIIEAGEGMVEAGTAVEFFMW